MIGQGFQDVEDTNKHNENKMLKFLRIYLMRNRMNVEDIRILFKFE